MNYKYQNCTYNKEGVINHFKIRPSVIAKSEEVARTKTAPTVWGKKERVESDLVNMYFGLNVGYIPYDTNRLHIMIEHFCPDTQKAKRYEKLCDLFRYYFLGCPIEAAIEGLEETQQFLADALDEMWMFICDTFESLIENPVSVELLIPTQKARKIICNSNERQKRIDQFFAGN